MIGSKELAEGLCTGIWKTDPSLYHAFFHEKSEAQRKRAKAVCARCPVKDACLERALDNGEVFGVWGGTGRRDREALQKARARVARSTLEGDQ